MSASTAQAHDLLFGAEEIAAHIETLAHGRKIKPTKVYYWLRRGQLPAGKKGSMWIGSKRVLNEHFQLLTRWVDTEAEADAE